MNKSHVMRILIGAWAFFLWATVAALAGPAAGILPELLKEIDLRQAELGSCLVSPSSLETGPDVVAFTDEMEIKEAAIKIRTLFSTQQDTVEKRLLIKQEKATTSFSLKLDNANTPFTQSVERSPAGDCQVYIRPTDTFIYTQGKDALGNVLLKEWIYASIPNAGEATCYVWHLSSDDPSYSVTLREEGDGTIGIYRQMNISGIDQSNTHKRQSIFDAVRKALGSDMPVSDNQLLVRLSPLVYWTRDGARNHTPLKLETNHSFSITIQEPQSSYPLLIDPTLAWGQWLGGSDVDYVRALAVNGDEIYAGGYTNKDATSWGEAITWQGSYSGGTYEGFVVEIADGSTPSIAWGQWLGGSGNDYVRALAVNGDEIYAGGYAGSDANWGEAITWQGSYSGSYEGFVVEIADGPTPSIAWGQWLGGSGSDYVYALAVTEDEIYAGGEARTDEASWGEAITWQGSYSGGEDEGFVVEIADGSTPSIAWAQWLGSSGDDKVYALAVNGDEIYAGGYGSSDPSSWGEAITWYGTYSGGTEGFVVEIADGPTPSIAWGQWLGGLGNDYVYALAVTGDEIYAGGYAANLTNWYEVITWYGSYSGGSFEGFVVEIADGPTPSIAWGQWLGGSGWDYVYALAVTGDEIYAGGEAQNATSWGEAITWYGSYSGGINEGFVVEIADGTTPSTTWGQWLGTYVNDYVYALVVTGDEIYAGGYAGSDATSWGEAITWQGSFSGISSESFVVEIGDDAEAGAAAEAIIQNATISNAVILDK
jgi:disulfide oxidoreductase YuzD